MNVLTVAPGGVVTGLYTETIPLFELGALHVERLTTIEFNDSTQQWEVTDRQGHRLFADPSRAVCLQWEHQHFNQ
jgi:hypothetical protein